MSATCPHLEQINVLMALARRANLGEVSVVSVFMGRLLSGIEAPACLYPWHAPRCARRSGSRCKPDARGFVLLGRIASELNFDVAFGLHLK
jgi:hypothetical protein